MKKKIISLCLATSLLAAALAGCGSSNKSQTSGATSQASQTPQASQESSAAKNQDENQGIPLDAFAGTTLKIAVYKHSMDTSNNFNDKEAFKLAEEATGIHIDWIEVPAGTESEKTNIMLSADMPDAFLGLLKETQIASNMDLFYDLSESGLLDTYAPNVVADVNTLSQGFGVLEWPDGSIRTLLTSRATSYNNWADGIMVINMAWLDQLNLDLPRTADEFYEVLKAFKENDMNGNGDSSDEIPLEFCENNWAAHIMNLANPFGIAGYGEQNEKAYMMIKNGKVEPTMNTDACRSFLEYYHKLAAEGLLDVEGFSQTNEQFYSKLKEDVVGCYLAFSPYSNMTEEKAANYVVLSPFSALDGVEPVKTGERNRLQADRCGLAISADCSNVKALLHWWNYLSGTTELKYTSRYGAQGDMWDIDENSLVYSKTPADLKGATSDTAYSYIFGVVDRGTFIRADETLYVSKEENFNTWFRQCMTDEMEPWLQDEYLPVRFSDPEKTSERAFLEKELFDYIANFVATSIVEGVTDQSWEHYLKQLEVYRYDEWIQWYQDFLDSAQ